MSKPEDNDPPKIDPRLESILGAIPSEYGDAPATPPGFAMADVRGAPPSPVRTGPPPLPRSTQPQDTPAAITSQSVRQEGAAPDQELQASETTNSMEVHTGVGSSAVAGAVPYRAGHDDDTIDVALEGDTTPTSVTIPPAAPTEASTPPPTPVPASGTRPTTVQDQQTPPPTVQAQATPLPVDPVRPTPSSPVQARMAQSGDDQVTPPPVVQMGPIPPLPAIRPMAAQTAHGLTPPPVAPVRSTPSSAIRAQVPVDALVTPPPVITAPPRSRTPQSVPVTVRETSGTVRSPEVSQVRAASFDAEATPPPVPARIRTPPSIPAVVPPRPAPVSTINPDPEATPPPVPASPARSGPPSTAGSAPVSPSSSNAAAVPIAIPSGAIPAVASGPVSSAPPAGSGPARTAVYSPSGPVSAPVPGATGPLRVPLPNGPGSAGLAPAPVPNPSVSSPAVVPAAVGNSIRVPASGSVSQPSPEAVGAEPRRTSAIGVPVGAAGASSPPPVTVSPSVPPIPSEPTAEPVPPAALPRRATPVDRRAASEQAVPDEVPFEELEIVDAPQPSPPAPGGEAAATPSPPPVPPRSAAPPPPPQSAATPAKPAIPIPPLPVLPEPLAQRPRRRKRSKPWFEEVFDEDYLRTLPFMTAEQTVREVTFIEESLALQPGSTVLDVGCGYGRHAIELVQRGLDVTGLDLSLPLLIRAADESQRRSMAVNYVHADMREMAFEGRFDAAYCMLTTFGYFDEDSNLKVAQGIARALKPGGRFLLDTVNRDYIVGDLPTRVWWEGDGCVVLEEVDFNFHTSRLVTRRSVVFEDGRQLEQEISIRCYSLHELGKLLRHAGFRVLDISGSLATRSRFFGATSRNIIILAEKRVD